MKWTLSGYRELISALICLLMLSGCVLTTAKAITKPITSTNEIVVGAEQPSIYLPLLRGKRVGLVVNQTSMVGETHLVDYLLANNINVQMVFAPEHGFRGNHDAGAKVDHTVDAKTGINLISIYGNERKPSAQLLSQLDVIVFDIQDVGVRFYTFISSMHYMMEAAADAEIAFMVLDRPNPNGRFVDGPTLKPSFRSFVGMHEIPLLHGMTVGELAQMIVGEHWLQTSQMLNLVIVPMKNYFRDTQYRLPVNPSPNLPNELAVALYPSLAFFEATPVSIGRGTLFPFQVIGHNEVFVGSFQFTPRTMPGAALAPKLMDQTLTGQDLRHSVTEGLDLSFLLAWHQRFKQMDQPFFTRANFMDKLAGTDQLRLAIEAGHSEQQIRASWQAQLQQFLQKRQAYLLYP